jgi:hypothetical protein
MVSSEVTNTQPSGGTGQGKIKMGRRMKKPKEKHRSWIQMALRANPVTKKAAKGEKAV